MFLYLEIIFRCHGLYGALLRSVCTDCIISVGRSGSSWMEKVCREMDIPTMSNRVDIGVRVELPAVIFSHLTDELYASKEN